MAKHLRGKSCPRDKAVLYPTRQHFISLSRQYIYISEPSIRLHYIRYTLLITSPSQIRLVYAASNNYFHTITQLYYRFQCSRAVFSRARAIIASRGREERPFLDIRFAESSSREENSLLCSSLQFLTTLVTLPLTRLNDVATTGRVGGGRRYRGARVREGEARVISWKFSKFPVAVAAYDIPGRVVAGGWTISSRARNCTTPVKFHEGLTEPAGPRASCNLSR